MGIKSDVTKCVQVLSCGNQPYVTIVTIFYTWIDVVKHMTQTKKYVKTITKKT